MTHEEMSNLTNEELANFSHLELSLERTELLQHIVNNVRDDIPSAVLIKLQRICQDYLVACEKYDIDIPKETKPLKNKKSLSITEIVSIVGLIINMLTLALAAYSTFAAQPANTYINQIINENYINNIDIIIKELSFLRCKKL